MEGGGFYMREGGGDVACDTWECTRVLCGPVFFLRLFDLFGLEVIGSLDKIYTYIK